MRVFTNAISAFESISLYCVAIWLSSWLCMCVYTDVNMRVYMWIRIVVCIHMCVFTRFISASDSICVYIYLEVRTQYTYINIWTHIYTNTVTYIYIYIWMYIYVYTYMCIYAVSYCTTSSHTARAWASSSATTDTPSSPTKVRKHPPPNTPKKTRMQYQIYM